MRAAVFKEVSKPLAIEAIADPVPGAHDIILRVKNCGICGSDLHMTEPGTMMPLPGGINRMLEKASEHHFRNSNRSRLRSTSIRSFKAIASGRPPCSAISA